MLTDTRTSVFTKVSIKLYHSKVINNLSKSFCIHSNGIKWKVKVSNFVIPTYSLEHNWSPTRSNYSNFFGFFQSFFFFWISFSIMRLSLVVDDSSKSLWMKATEITIHHWSKSNKSLNISELNHKLINLKYWTLCESINKILIQPEHFAFYG